MQSMGGWWVREGEAQGRTGRDHMMSPPPPPNPNHVVSEWPGVMKVRLV